MFKLVLLIFFILPTYSYAYLGPGMGSGAIAATIGIVVAIFAAIFGTLWFPIKRFLNNRKNKTRQNNKK